MASNIVNRTNPAPCDPDIVKQSGALTDEPDTWQIICSCGFIKTWDHPEDARDDADRHVTAMSNG